MNLLLPGLYIPTDSPVHRLDPRVKMGAALLMMALPFATPNLASNLLLVGFVAVVVLLASVPLGALVRTLRAVFWVGFIMFFFYLFTAQGEPLVAIGGVAVTWEGVLAGATQIYRLCLLVIITSLLSYATSPTQLAHGLEAALGPLARLGLPVREMAMVLTIALRFVPTLFDEVDKIVKAQEARGASVRSGNPWQRVRGWVPLFVPIFVSVFRRAEALATAMEARGFRGAHERTRLHRLRLARRDLWATLIILAVCLAVVGLDRFA